MTVDTLLTTADVVVVDYARDKPSLLRELTTRLAARNQLDPAKLARAILAREQLGSTGIGRGVALPHARLNEVSSPRALMALLQRPCPFDAIDGTAVDLLVVLALPAADDAASLHALSAVSRLLRDATTCTAIRRSADEASICEVVRTFQQGQSDGRR